MEKTLIIILLAALVVACCMLYKQYRELRVLRKNDRMQKAFLQNINHEIRVPLKAIKSLAGTVGQEDLYLSKNEKRSISEQMVYNSNLVSTLVDELVMFANADETVTLKVESFSPNALCRRCLEANVLNIYHRKAVRMQFRRELNDEFFIHSDRHLVELIINKLVVNACRFTEQGEVSVGCNLEEFPDCLTISVSDTGVGIPENRLGNIFTFFEEPDDVKDEAELDLSICSKLAEKLGGRLYHDDTQQKGTRMMLVLPLR